MVARRKPLLHRLLAAAVRHGRACSVLLLVFTAVYVVILPLLAQEKRIEEPALLPGVASSSLRWGPDFDPQTYLGVWTIVHKIETSKRVPGVAC